MRNQNGITLVELMATLAIVGVIVVLIASVLTNGTNASQRISLDQRLQQEGNIIVEKIRYQYLKNHQSNLLEDLFTIKVENDRLILEDGIERIVLSEGYKYVLSTAALNPLPVDEPVILNRKEKSDFNLIIRGKNNGDASYQEYIIDTSFSKLN